MIYILTVDIIVLIYFYKLDQIWSKLTTKLEHLTEDNEGSTMPGG